MNPVDSATLSVQDDGDAGGVLGCCGGTAPRSPCRRPTSCPSRRGCLLSFAGSVVRGLTIQFIEPPHQPQIPLRHRPQLTVHARARVRSRSHLSLPGLRENRGVAHPSSDAPGCPFVARCLSYRWAVWMMVEPRRFANWNAGLDYDYQLLIDAVCCRDLSGPYRASAAPASRR